MDDDQLSATPGRRAADRSPAPGRWSSRPSAARSSSTSPSLTRKALDRRASGLLDANQIEQLALSGRDRQLADLADPPGLVLPDPRRVGARSGCFRSTAARSSATIAVWCPQWWRHAEAVARLESLWRAWEHLRQDAATGLSVWFRDHADHHMTVLLDADGPFKGCDGHHSERPLEPLPQPATAPRNVQARRQLHRPQPPATLPSATTTAARAVNRRGVTRTAHGNKPNTKPAGITAPWVIARRPLESLSEAACSVLIVRCRPARSLQGRKLPSPR